MKRKIINISIITAIILVIFGYGMYYYYAPPKERKPYPITKNDDDTIRVAYIGDSWAFFHQPYDKIISEVLSKKLNRPAKVISLGFCGRSSKEIYWRLFDDTIMKSFISKGFDYCIVSAGINDSNKKMSTLYYIRSIEYIINFMLFNNTTPIIIEIPDYDIEKMYRMEMSSRKLLRRFSRLVTGTAVNCKKDFRQALDDLFKVKDYKDKVYIIKYNTWNSNYSEDQITLYKDDGIHLNEKGYVKLDSCIIETCLRDYQKKHGKD